MDGSNMPNKGPVLSFVSNMYDKVVGIIPKGLILNGEYEVIKQDAFITTEDIRKMTEESINGKIFYILNINDISFFSTRRIDKDFVIRYVAIIIAGGKRYKVKARGKEWLKNAESSDFSFVEIQKEDIVSLTDSNIFAGGDM